MCILERPPPVTELLSLSMAIPWMLPRTSLAPAACAAPMNAAVSFCGCTWAVVPSSAISCSASSCQPLSGRDECAVQLVFVHILARSDVALWMGARQGHQECKGPNQQMQ